MSRDAVLYEASLIITIWPTCHSRLFCISVATIKLIIKHHYFSGECELGVLVTNVADQLINLREFPLLHAVRHMLKEVASDNRLANALSRGIPPSSPRVNCASI